MASKIVQSGFQHVKPLVSADRAQARMRAIRLFRAWYRQIPFMIVEYDLYLTVGEARTKVKEIFRKNKGVTDVRIIDLLIFKGQQDLVEVVNSWKQRLHIMKYFKDTEEARPTDFLSKFIAGHES